MVLYLLDNNFQRIAVIDSYASLIWTKRYWDVGDFELYLSANTSVDFQKGFYVQKADDNNTLMKIDTIKLSEDAENGDYLTISGKSFENILSSRIVWYKTRYVGSAETVMYSLFLSNFKFADNVHRNISQLSIAPFKGLVGTVSGEYNGEELLEVIQSICRQKGFGFRFNRFQFEIYKGTDRTFNSNNPVVIFSPDFGNVSNSNYTQDRSAHKNVCLAYAESSQNAYGRNLVTSGGENAGMNRYETFSDCGTEEDTALMLAAAEETLSEDTEHDIFESEIIPQLATNDYDLGDIIQLADNYNNKAAARITEIIECDSAEGHTVVPTFEVIQV